MLEEKDAISKVGEIYTRLSNLERALSEAGFRDLSGAVKRAKRELMLPGVTSVVERVEGPNAIRE